MTLSQTIGLWLCCLLAAIALDAQNQQAAKSLILQPEELLRMELESQSNAAYIQQIGRHNEVNLQQIQLPDGGTNVAKIQQDGVDNYALIVQQGGGNQLTLVQSGHGNAYELINEAYHNDLLIVQDGNHNTVTQQLINSNRVNVEFVQQGNNNEIIQVLNGVHARDYKVRQIGNDLKVIIRQSSF
ncbi:MAG: hypothetical protein AAGG75_12325 [Bacteroidota bacterium]